MKVHIFLDEGLSKKTFNLIREIEQESTIVVADKLLYNELKKELPNKNYLWIDLFEDCHSSEKVKIAEGIVHDLLSINPKLLDNGYDLSEFPVNTIYKNFVSILYNLIIKIDELINHKEVTSITLYGGSPHEQHLGLTLSENERPFRFLYKRSWYLNHFINQAFKEKMNIEWKYKTPKLYLKMVNYIKPKLILYAKLLLILKKISSNNKQGNISDKDLKGNTHTLFFVRNPIQVEPLKPLYSEYKKKHESNPLFISLENYSNNKLKDTLQKHKVKYFDLYQLLSPKSLLKVFSKTKTIKKVVSENTIKKNINNYIIEIDYDKIANELTIYWFDILLFTFLLESFEKKVNKKINNVINNETHGYYSAVEAEWAKKNGVSSAGIQHVSISNVMLPKISRVDVMFMMSQEITDLLTAQKKDEKFVYTGPVSYDHFFNTSKHTKHFKKIAIFSQPDDLKKDYFQIIEDIIDILGKNNLDIDVCLKLHPREKDIYSFSKFKNTYKNFRIITDEQSSSELIAESDLILSIHSGTLMQSILIGTPSISINYNNRYNIKADYILDDVTKKVSSKKELEEQFMNLDKLNQIYFYNRQKYLDNKLEKYDGNAASKVYDYIENIVRKN